MGALTSDAAALIRSGKAALRPDASDRKRVLESLERTLGPGALLDGPRDVAAAHGASAARLSTGWAKLLGGLSVLAVMGAGVITARHLGASAPAQVPDTLVASIASTPPAAPVASLMSSNEGECVAERSRSDDPTAGGRTRRQAAARTTPDALTEEVRLLTKAARQLSGGIANEALKTLGEHERRFPKGALAEERMAARVEALCALGRFPEARGDLTGLARAYPRSAHVDAARRFCGNDQVNTLQDVR